MRKKETAEVIRRSVILNSKNLKNYFIALTRAASRDL